MFAGLIPLNILVKNSSYRV